MSSPSQRMTARSTAFFSPRMFPGQSYARSTSMAWGCTPVKCLPESWLNFSTKCWTSIGIVLASLAQGRQGNLEDVEAEEEVLAEAAGADLRLQVTIGGAEHPDVDLDLRLARELEPPLLEHPEQLGLELEGNLSHSSRNSVPPWASFEDARPPLVGAGERPALVAEELALHEGRGMEAQRWR